MNNNLHVLDINSGKFEKKFEKKSFDPIQFYCKYISKSGKDCNIAKSNRLKPYNRDPNYFAGVSYDEDIIYISTGFEMLVPWESSMYGGLKYITYVNELGEKEKFKYEIFGESYPGLLKLDTSLNLLDAYYVNIQSYPKENRVPEKSAFWGASDRGFYIKDSILIIDNNPDAININKKLRKRANHAYSVFKLGEKNTFNFEKFLPIEYDRNYTKYLDWHNRTYHFQLKDKLYANIINGGYINELNDNYNTYRLKGLGNELIKENVPQFIEDTSWFKVNYRSLSANSIFDDSYALVLYYYQDRPALELLEEDDFGNLKTVQVMDLSNVEGFSTLESNLRIPHNGDGVCINDDKIYLMQFEKGEYYLYEYSITLRKKKTDSVFKKQETGN